MISRNSPSPRTPGRRRLSTAGAAAAAAPAVSPAKQRFTGDTAMSDVGAVTIAHEGSQDVMSIRGNRINIGGTLYEVEKPIPSLGSMIQNYYVPHPFSKYLGPGFSADAPRGSQYREEIEEEAKEIRREYRALNQPIPSIHDIRERLLPTYGHYEIVTKVKYPEKHGDQIGKYIFRSNRRLQPLKLKEMKDAGNINVAENASIHFLRSIRDETTKKNQAKVLILEAFNRLREKIIRGDVTLDNINGFRHIDTFQFQPTELRENLILNMLKKAFKELKVPEHHLTKEFILLQLESFRDTFIDIVNHYKLIQGSYIFEGHSSLYTSRGAQDKEAKDELTAILSSRSKSKNRFIQYYDHHRLTAHATQIHHLASLSLEQDADIESLKPLPPALEEPHLGNVGYEIGDSELGDAAFSRLQAHGLRALSVAMTAAKDKGIYLEVPVYMPTGQGKSYLADNYLREVCEQQNFRYVAVSLRSSNLSLERALRGKFGENPSQQTVLSFDEFHYLMKFKQDLIVNMYNHDLRNGAIDFHDKEISFPLSRDNLKIAEYYLQTLIRKLKAEKRCILVTWGATLNIDLEQAKLSRSVEQRGEEDIEIKRRLEEEKRKLSEIDRQKPTNPSNSPRTIKRFDRWFGEQYEPQLLKVQELEQELSGNSPRRSRQLLVESTLEEQISKAREKEEFALDVLTKAKKTWKQTRGETDNPKTANYSNIFEFIESNPPEGEDPNILQGKITKRLVLSPSKPVYINLGLDDQGRTTFDFPGDPFFSRERLEQYVTQNPQAVVVIPAYETDISGEQKLVHVAARISGGSEGGTFEMVALRTENELDQCYRPPNHREVVSLYSVDAVGGDRSALGQYREGDRIQMLYFVEYGKELPGGRQNDLTTGLINQMIGRLRSAPRDSDLLAGMSVFAFTGRCPDKVFPKSLSENPDMKYNPDTHTENQPPWIRDILQRTETERGLRRLAYHRGMRETTLNPYPFNKISPEEKLAAYLSRIKEQAKERRYSAVPHIKDFIYHITQELELMNKYRSAFRGDSDAAMMSSPNNRPLLPVPPGTSFPLFPDLDEQQLEKIKLLESYKQSFLLFLNKAIPQEYLPDDYRGNIEDTRLHLPAEYEEARRRYTEIVLKVQNIETLEQYENLMKKGGELEQEIEDFKEEARQSQHQYEYDDQQEGQAAAAGPSSSPKPGGHSTLSKIEQFKQKALERQDRAQQVKLKREKRARQDADGHNL